MKYKIKIVQIKRKIEIGLLESTCITKWKIFSFRSGVLARDGRLDIKQLDPCLYFFGYCHVYVSRVIVKYTRPGELRGIINFSLPIRPSRSLRVRSPTFPITAAPQPLPIRLRRRPMAFSLGSVCLISFLVPCSSARKRDYTAVATAAATVAPCIDRGRCSPVERNNVNQTRGWRGQVATAPLVWGWRNIRQWHWNYRPEYTRERMPRVVHSMRVFPDTIWTSLTFNFSVSVDSWT